MKLHNILKEVCLTSVVSYCINTSHHDTSLIQKYALDLERLEEVRGSFVFKWKWKKQYLKNNISKNIPLLLLRTAIESHHINSMEQNRSFVCDLFVSFMWWTLASLLSHSSKTRTHKQRVTLLKTRCARGARQSAEMQTPTTKRVHLPRFHYENKGSQEKVKATREFETGESASTGRRRTPKQPELEKLLKSTEKQRQCGW